MRNYIKIAVCCLLLTGLIYSCDVINPEESIPAYIHIPEFRLETGLGQGSNSHNITDVWLTVGTEFSGCIPYPLLFR